jgi:hypothetical protein
MGNLFSFAAVLPPSSSTVETELENLYGTGPPPDNSDVSPEFDDQDPGEELQRVASFNDEDEDPPSY